MRAPTFGSLFAGVGGFDLGLEAAGWQCAFQVEWDKHCQSVLRHHWPTVPKWGDVQEVDGATLPPVDMITFGSPCQDLSVAGKRAGLQGGRSSMFFEATRIIREMRNATNNVYPRTAIWENVTGALTSNNGADFGAVLDEMAHLGAVAIEWRVLDAQHFGVPQRRRRVFVVAIFDPATADRCPNPLLPVREGRRGDFAKGRKKGQEVAGTLGGGADASSTHRKLGHGHYVEDDTASTLKGCDHKDATDLAVIACQVDGSFVASTLRGFGHGWQGQHNTTNAIIQPVTVCQPGASAKAYGIGYEEEMAPILESGDGGNNKPAIIQPTTISLAVRRLTPLECERLMGWPDDHTRYTDTGKEQANTNRYKQCGNGVAAPVAEWIGRHLHPLHVHHD